MVEQKKKPIPAPAQSEEGDHLTVTSTKRQQPSKEEQMETLKELIDSGKISPAAVYELMEGVPPEEEDPEELRRRAMIEAQHQRDMQIVEVAVNGAVLVTIYEQFADKMTAIQVDVLLKTVYESAPWYHQIVMSRMAQVMAQQGSAQSDPTISAEEEPPSDIPTPEELAETRKLQEEMKKKPQRPASAPEVKVEEPEDHTTGQD